MILFKKIYFLFMHEEYALTASDKTQNRPCATLNNSLHGYCLALINLSIIFARGQWGGGGGVKNKEIIDFLFFNACFFCFMFL